MTRRTARDLSDLQEGPENDLMQSLNGKPMSRRDFLRTVGLAGATFTVGAGLGGALSGCSGGGTTTTAGATPTIAGATTSATSGVSLITTQDSVNMTLSSTLENLYHKMWNMGAEQACNALGVKYEVLAHSNQAETLISQFETSAQQGVNMFSMVPVESAAVPRIAELANANKAYMVDTWMCPDWYTPFVAGDYWVTYFVPESVLAGYTMAKVLFDSMGGKGNFIHLFGWPGTPDDWQRTKGVDQALKEYPNIVMLDRQPGKYNRIDARAMMEDMITKHGADKIEGVFGQNDDVGIGAMNALEAVGKTTVPIVGLDGNQETCDLIREGRYTATLASFPVWQGGYAAVRAFDAANGWVPTAPERQMHTGSGVVDKSNVDGYVKKFYESDVADFDWALMSRVLHPDDWDPQNDVWALDLDAMWEGQPKPADFEYPKAYTDAKAAGELDKITQLYKDHYKKKIM